MKTKAPPVNDRDIFQEVEADYGYIYGEAENSYVDYNQVAAVDLQKTQEVNDRFLSDTYNWLPVKDGKLYGKILQDYSIRSYNSGLGVLFRVEMANKLEETLEIFKVRSGGFTVPKEININISDESTIYSEFYDKALEIFKERLDNKKCSGIREFSRILLEDKRIPDSICFPLYYLFKTDDQLNPLSLTWTDTDASVYGPEFYNDLNFRYFLKFMYARGFLVDLHNPTMIHYKATQKEILDNSVAMNAEESLKETLENLWSGLGNINEIPKTYYKSRDYKKLLKNILTKYNVASNVPSNLLGNNSRFNKYIREATKRIINERSNSENRTISKGDSLVY